MKAFVLMGWGIECEAEMRRAAQASKAFSDVVDLVMPKLIRRASDDKAEVKWPFSRGDWVLIPGGFSFSDHFGSGKLTALKLKEMGFFDAVRDLELNLLGVCNGFQILTESGLFGETTKLLANSPAGFKNRWVELQSASAIIRLPVRHGEGRLVWEGSLPGDVRPFLHYVSEGFENGSREGVAGLVRRRGSALICGMMPHPEIALSKLDDPDVFATDYLDQYRQKMWDTEGPGLQLLNQIFRKEIAQ